MTCGSRIVETTGARMFGLDDGEVLQRRRYVGHVRSEIEVRGAYDPLKESELGSHAHFYRKYVPRSKDILKVTVCATAFCVLGRDILRCS
jgi:hypothetical protein